jgi:hypothetical protein
MDGFNFTPQEIEFQADNEMITIVPEETMDALHMAQV